MWRSGSSGALLSAVIVVVAGCGTGPGGESDGAAPEASADAVDAGEADPSQLAYLVDRVAVNRGRPQRYGSQAGCVDLRAEAGRIEDRDDVDRRRAAVGLPPLADYLAELEELCADEQ